MEEDDREFLIRLITSNEEMKEAFLLMYNEGWNWDLRRFKTLWEVFPSNVFVTVKKNTNEVVATLSVLPTRGHHYFLRKMVVKKSYRGLGLGTRMIQHAIDNMHSKDTLTLTTGHGLDLFYSKLGFEKVEPSYHIYKLKVDRAKVTSACSDHKMDDTTIGNYHPGQFQDLNQYDKRARGYDGERFLEIMTQTSDHLLVATSQNTDQVMGYVAGVNHASFLSVDGLYADNDGIAIHLFRELLGAYPNVEEIRLQTIKPREFLLQFGDINWHKSFKKTRLTKGQPAPLLLLSKLYNVNDMIYE